MEEDWLKLLLFRHPLSNLDTELSGNFQLYTLVLSKNTSLFFFKVVFSGLYVLCVILCTIIQEDLDCPVPSLSSPVWSHKWPCFSLEVGIKTFWGPFQSEWSCDSWFYHRELIKRKKIDCFWIILVGTLRAVLSMIGFFTVFSHSAVFLC